MCISEDINHKIKEAVEKKKQEEVKQAEDLKKAENVSIDSVP